MDKLVQHIKIGMHGIPKQGMYCYGEASLETNMEMQEPLEKLYNYENQPDMREKVREYISELDVEIKRCTKIAEQNMEDDATTLAEMMFARMQTLMEVKDDLQGRLEELV